jgi:pyruvate/2-oxoglutarate/acetoin dehydrogenase E1 component
MTHAFDYLDAPVLNCTGKDVPMPYAANLEKLALPNRGRSGRGGQGRPLRVRGG